MNEEPEEFIKTVYKVSESDIRKTGVTQCVHHAWQKLNDNEIYCPVCQTGAIVNPECLDDYVK
jgi:hypothetical protein